VYVILMIERLAGISCDRSEGIFRFEHPRDIDKIHRARIMPILADKGLVCTLERS
jgi:hypothetical protein